jgi:5-methylcytosine-specific restriction endonuclease McrA
VLYALGDGYCGICEKPLDGKFQVDHVVPLSRGGLHCHANTQLTHQTCNERKHDRLPTIAELERALLAERAYLDAVGDDLPDLR